MRVEAAGSPALSSPELRPGQRVRRLLAPVGLAAAGCAGALVVWFADPVSGSGFPLPPCPINWLFGVDCPGCGGTRMLYSLLHGDVLAALHYNAVTFALIPLFVWSWVAWIVAGWRGRPVYTWVRWRWTPLTALVVFAVWSVVRNLPFPPFDALYV